MVKLEISFSRILLGKVIIDEGLDAMKYDELSTAFQAAGLEIVDSRTNKLVEDTRAFIREYLDLGIENQFLKLSSFLSSKMMLEFDYLSSLFSANSGETIERYFIRERIEKAKKLIAAGELSFLQISYEMGFSSVHHFSSQFKKVTGITPSQYKLQLSRDNF